MGQVLRWLFLLARRTTKLYCEVGRRWAVSVFAAELKADCFNVLAQALASSRQRTSEAVDFHAGLQRRWVSLWGAFWFRQHRVQRAVRWLISRIHARVICQCWLALVRHHAAAKLSRVVGAADDRRICILVFSGWSHLACKKAATARLVARSERAFASRHLTALHEYASRRRHEARRALRCAAMHAHRERALVFSRWRRQMRMRATVRAFELCWLEATAVACFRALWLDVQRVKAEVRHNLRAEAGLSSVFRADRSLYTTAHYCMVRWMLLLGAAALTSWIEFARTRVRLRALLCSARASLHRRLLAGVLCGWREWMWHEQLMMRVRHDLANERREDALSSGGHLTLLRAVVAPRPSERPPTPPAARRLHLSLPASPGGVAAPFASPAARAHAACGPVWLPTSLAPTATPMSSGMPDAGPAWLPLTPLAAVRHGGEWMTPASERLAARSPM